MTRAVNAFSLLADAQIFRELQKNLSPNGVTQSSAKLPRSIT